MGHVVGLEPGRPVAWQVRKVEHREQFRLFAVPAGAVIGQAAVGWIVVERVECGCGHQHLGVLFKTSVSG